jgi:hypothetical protein
MALSPNRLTMNGKVKVFVRPRSAATFAMAEWGRSPRNWTLHGNVSLAYDAANALSSVTSGSRVALMTPFRTATGVPLVIILVPRAPILVAPLGCKSQNAWIAACQATTARSTESVFVMSLLLRLGRFD